MKIRVTSHHVWNLRLDEEGQDLIEYALATALIALTAVAGLDQIAVQISSAFSMIGSTFTSALS